MSIEIKYRRDLWQILQKGGNAAEIGVAEGLFSRDILEWPCCFPIVYLVDRWLCCPDVKGDSAQPQEWHNANFQNVNKLVSPYGGRAVILRGDSHLMAKHVPDKSLAFVNIDADHSYEGVIRDAIAWELKLMHGGVMAFHDYESPQYGVKRAVQDFCRRRYEINLIPENNQHDAGAWFRVC